MKAAKGCPEAPATAEAFSESRRDRVADHLRACVHCSAEWSSLERLATTARAVKPLTLDETAKSEIRARLLAGAQDIQPDGSSSVRKNVRRTYVALALTAAAMATVLAWVRMPSPSLSTVGVSGLFIHRATVRGHHGAIYAEISGQPDEVVRLYEGTITVDVEPLRQGERFRVVTGDAQVEVIGTVFEVTAREGELAAVEVRRGRVEVRGPDEQPNVLLAGSRWDPSATSNDERNDEMATASGAAPPLVVVPVAASSSTGQAAVPREPSEAELAFQRGWAALRDGDEEAASRAFAGVPEKAPLGPDATFWRGIALGRAGRTSEAIAVLERFLRARPTSPHAPQARSTLATLRAHQKRPHQGTP